MTEMSAGSTERAENLRDKIGKIHKYLDEANAIAEMINGSPPALNPGPRTGEKRADEPPPLKILYESMDSAEYKLQHLIERISAIKDAIG